MINVPNIVLFDFCIWLTEQFRSAYSYDEFISRNHTITNETDILESLAVSFLAGAALTSTSFKVPSKAALAVFTNSANAFSSAIANSDNIFLLISILALAKPLMNLE